MQRCLALWYFGSLSLWQSTRQRNRNQVVSSFGSLDTESRSLWARSAVLGHSEDVEVAMKFGHNSAARLAIVEFEFAVVQANWGWQSKRSNMAVERSAVDWRQFAVVGRLVAAEAVKLQKKM